MPYQIFFEVNSWTLHCAALKKDQGFDAASLMHDTRAMLAKFRPDGPLSYVRYFRHFNMSIDLCPTGVAHLCLPENLDPRNIQQLIAFQSAQDPAVMQRSIVLDANICQMFHKALSCFANRQYTIFKSLRSLTLEVGFHLPFNDPSQRFSYGCGLKFRLIILMGSSSHGSPKIKSETIADLLALEPRRRMLAPLAKLRDVESVEVCRRQVHSRVICSHLLRSELLTRRLTEV